MPSHIHEVFLARVVEEIQICLRAFTSTTNPNTNLSIATFAQKIKYNGSSRLDLPNDEENDGRGNGTTKLPSIYNLLHVIYSLTIL